MYLLPRQELQHLLSYISYQVTWHNCGRPRSHPCYDQLTELLSGRHFNNKLCTHQESWSCRGIGEYSLHYSEEVCFENVDRQVPIIHTGGRRLPCFQMNAIGSERVVDTHHDGVRPMKGLPIHPSSPPLPPSQSKRNSDPNIPRRGGISSPSRSESSAPCNIPLNLVDDGVPQPGQPQRRIRPLRWVKSLGLADALIWFVSFAMALKYGIRNVQT